MNFTLFIKLFHDFMLYRKMKARLQFLRNIVSALTKSRSCEWSVIELSFVHFVVYVTLDLQRVLFNKLRSLSHVLQRSGVFYHSNTQLRLLYLLYDIEKRWWKTIKHGFSMFYTLIKHGFWTNHSAHNIHEHEANNCLSIITQVIIETPRRWKFFCCKAAISDGDRKALARTISPVFPPDWDVKLRQTFLHHCKFGLFKPFC